MSECQHDTHRDPPCIWCEWSIVSKPPKSKLFCLRLSCIHNPNSTCQYEPIKEREE